jgi:phosphoenolpyruvate-protein kinase (PTS system EI component)
MLKSGIDQDALIAQFSNASAQQSEQLRKAVHDATLGALQGRELSLKNIRSVVKTVGDAAATGAAQNHLEGVDVEGLLDKAVSGMDDALLKAVEANQVALKQFVNQGVDMGDKHLKKAIDDLDKIEDALIGQVKKFAKDADAQLSSQWGHVLDKLQAGGTLTGAKATLTGEQLMTQMQTAIRDSRASSLKAAQALAESYTALVSGVLIGMSDAIRSGAAAAPAKATKSKK